MSCRLARLFLCCTKYHFGAFFAYCSQYVFRCFLMVLSPFFACGLAYCSQYATPKIRDVLYITLLECLFLLEGARSAGSRASGAEPEKAEPHAARPPSFFCAKRVFGVNFRAFVFQAKVAPKTNGVWRKKSATSGGDQARGVGRSARRRSGAVP